MPGTHIQGRVDGHLAEVLNLSLTGALLVYREAVPVDSQFRLLLMRDGIQVSVDAQVIRSDPATRKARWLVAVTFVSPSAEAKKAIPQLIMKNSRGR
jgi:PilZ domain